MKNTFLKARDKGNSFGSMLISTDIFLGYCRYTGFLFIYFFFI